MDHETVLAYLDRVGVTEPTAGDAAGLRTLHRAHQMAVPFENLSIHLAEPISLDERDLIDKIVHRRRGGTLDLKALAQQVKLPLSLLRLWASQVSAANTPRAVTEPGRVSSVVDVLRTAVNEAIWAGANAVRRKGLKLRADFETSLNPISKQSLFTQQRSQ